MTIQTKVKVGIAQKMAQSERNSHSKNRGWKKLNYQSDPYTKKAYRKLSEQRFPNRRPLSYPTLTSIIYKGKKLNKICSASFIGYLGSISLSKHISAALQGHVYMFSRTVPK